ncbi:MAG: carbohydrate kinase family protein, partial [Bacteroidales bacterium]
MKTFKISVAGCGLGDFVYNNVDFQSPAFQKYQSKISGDGGLDPGKLVFTQELERFTEVSFRHILNDIAGHRSYDTFNVGGPALVSAVNAAQLLYGEAAQVSFYGARGNDEKGDAILGLLQKLPLNLDHYLTLEGETPYTDVLSDPIYLDGKGERIFVNNIGCAERLSPDILDEYFWKSDMIVFGATALVPALHDNLTELLQKAKENGAFTLVHTVYDFPNEKKCPDQPWPLGDTVRSLPLIDLLLMDEEESLRISGATCRENAIQYYKQNGCNAFVITHGANPTYIYSAGKLFSPIETHVPVCQWIWDEFLQYPERKGDTTGCGDNFTGAVISSIVRQMISG